MNKELKEAYSKFLKSHKDDCIYNHLLEVDNKYNNLDSFNEKEIIEYMIYVDNYNKKYFTIGDGNELISYFNILIKNEEIKNRSTSTFDNKAKIAICETIPNCLRQLLNKLETEGVK